MSSTTMATDVWEENEMIWSTDQCPEIIWFNGVTLDDCQYFCETVASCTAINYGASTGHCTLLRCESEDRSTTVCPNPLFSATNYKGYCLTRGEWHNIVHNSTLNFWCFQNILTCSLNPSKNKMPKIPKHN